jgi:hypothetical protein
MKLEEDAESIQNLMESIRRRRGKRVSDLETEAHRLVDWKEYVRTAPLMSLIASAATGFLVFNTFVRPPSSSIARTDAPLSGNSPIQAKTTNRSKIPWLVSLAMPIITDAAKKYIKQSLLSAIQGPSSEPPSATHRASERRVNTN